MKKIYLTENQLGTLLVQRNAIQQLNESIMLNESWDKIMNYIKKALATGIAAGTIFASLSHMHEMDKIKEAKLWELIQMAQEEQEESKIKTYDVSKILMGDLAPILKGFEIMDYLMKHGATLEQAAGIAGNWHHESRFEANPIGVRDHGHAWGIAQWNDTEAAGARAQKLCKYLGLKSLKDIDNTNVYDQIDFAINGEGLLSKYFKGNETPEKAAEIICAKYEKPRLGLPGQEVNQLRQELAASYYNAYKQHKEEI